MTLDVQPGHRDDSGLQLLLKHLSKAEKGDIFLLDRDYPSRYLFSILESLGILLCGEDEAQLGAGKG